MSAPKTPARPVRERPKDVHVLPVRDLRAHTERRTCWCQPRVEYYGTCAVVSHHSADGRELIERHGVN